MFSSGAKVRDLAIHVDTGDTIGPKKLPVLYGHLDTHAILHAKVTLENSYDFKGNPVEICFKAVVKTHFFSKDEASRKHVGEQIFLMKHWELDVERPKPGWIGKGSYARLCSVILDPLLPSSSESPFGSMRYYFEARLKGAKGFGITRSDWVVAQEVWILNSSLPFYNNISIDNPTAVHGIWRDALKYSISIPSDLLYLGQRVAVTVQLHPFNQGSVYEGDEVQVIYATFTLRELKTFRAQFVRDVHQTTEKVLNITVNTAWRQSVDGWRKTINLSLPSSPIMSPNMQTKFMDVAHTLAVMIEFRTVKISKIEKLKAQLDVQITAPCFAPTLPPDYGETTRHVESLLLLEPPAIDPNESLPGYSRYE